jgi:nuclear transport factor 2 (NTF2) superfamily protein
LTTVEGKTEDEAAKTVVSYTRDAYEDGLFNRSKAADIMVTYGGITSEEAESKLQYIDVKKQFPDTFVDDAWVDEYYEEVESSGITIEVFVDYRNQVKSITGEGKKERRMAVINSMPISSAQKDALYYAEGWAASKLYEAPWR